MADYYYKTVGEAWAAIANAFTAFGDLTYLSAGFAIAWHPAGAPNGGYFSVDGSVYAGEAYANGNYYAQEGKTGGLIQFAQLLRQPGMANQPVVTSDPAVGRLSTSTLLFELYTTRVAMLADVTDVVITDLYQIDTTLSGGSGSFIVRELIQCANGWDQTLDVVSVVDMRFAPTGAPVSQPINPTYSASNPATVNNIIQAAPNLDVDATVNPGGGIYSITSRQLTTP